MPTEDSDYRKAEHKMLPKDAEVTRASGLWLCNERGKQLYDHLKYCYPWGENSAVKGCDGKFYHL